MKNIKSCSFYFITNFITRKYFICIIMAVAFIANGFFISTAFANTTDITEDISINTNWSVADSPFIIKNDIVVMEGVTLTIDPGVIIKFEYGTSFIVDGKLEALGTGQEPIYFTSSLDDFLGGDTNNDENNTYPNESDWGYVFIDSAEPKSILNNVFQKYSDQGLVLYDGGSVISDNFNSDKGVLTFGSNSSFSNLNIPFIEIYNNSSIYINEAIISNQSELPILVYNGSSLNIKNSKIEGLENNLVNIFENSSAVLDNVDATNDTSYIAAFSVYDGSSLNIKNSKIDNIYNGVEAYSDSSFSIIDSSIECENNGIVIYENSSLNISDGTISCQNDGIALYNEAKASIDRVKIINALDAGIIVYNNTDPNPVVVTNSEILNNNYGFVVFNSLVSVHQNNIHDNFTNGAFTFIPTDLDFINNYWGDKTGPTHSSNASGLGDAISDNILFVPFLESDPLIKTGFSNILFIPGIKGSRLYKEKSVLGLEVEDQLWEPNSNSDVVDLYLNLDGTSSDLGIYTKDIIKETNVPISSGLISKEIYKSFSIMMNDMVNNRDINEWKPYAYDWRYGVDDIVNNGTRYEYENLLPTDILGELIESSKSGKVTIIAHSNGGLLAKALLKKLEEDKIAGINNFIDKVDVLILVGSPEIGTASAVSALLHAYDQRLFFGVLMNEKTAREFGRNMIGAYGLLPSKEYINRVSASPVTFLDNDIASGVTTSLFQNFGSAIDSYEEYKDFLFGSDGRVNPEPSEINLPIILSQNLFTKSENLHNNIDNFIPPENLRVVEIAGWGLDTIASYEYYPKLTDCGIQGLDCYKLDERPRFTSDGDNTVITPSAHYMSLYGSEKYYVNLFKYNNDFKTKKGHSSLFEISPILDFLSNIIKNNTQIDPNYFSDIIPVDSKNRLRLSIHSPVTFDAYDDEENHTGKICPIESEFCYIEENIPNSSYSEFGEGKYLNLPEDKFSRVKLQGIDIGTFTYESEKVFPDGTSMISSFVDIPVTTQTKVEIELNQDNQILELNLDVTGDGTVDFTITPNKEFNPIFFLQVMKKTVESFDISKQQKNILLRRIDDTIKAIQKGKINKAKLKIEQFKKTLTIHPGENEKERRERQGKNERDHEREHKNNKKPKQLSQMDIQTLINMLNQLLDNLN